jgi:hypothetical protein
MKREGLLPFLASAVVVVHAGCGIRTQLRDDERPRDEGLPTRALSPDGEGCIADIEPSEAPPPSAGSGTRVALVEVFFTAECTGVGGDYVLARELEGSRSYWLGGRGCAFLDEGELGETAFGVLWAEVSAGLATIDPGLCVGFPGEDGLESDAGVTKLLLFDDLESARTFGEQVGAE